MFRYSEDQMESALAAVSRGESVASAAKSNGVPRSTLISRVKGNVQRFRQMGPESVLTKEEEKNIVRWIFTMAKAGFPIGKESLLTSVQHLIKELKRKNPFKDDRPGRKWYYSFLKRNPEVSTRTAQNLTLSRASVTKEHLDHWFLEISTYLKEHKFDEVLNDPKRIFNGDESAFFLNPKGSKVLAQKGDKTVYQQVNSDEKECLTVLVTGNAAGDLAPPMILFRYERIPREISESIPGCWGIGKSETGWMTGETFYEYISNVFYPWLLKSGIEFPIIIFLDGHASHLTLHLSKFCESKGIILIALFPNATHLIQPMDIAVFRTLKDGWKNKVQQWRLSNYDAPVLKKIHFSPLLAELLEERVTPSVLQSGFRKSGLFPWNPNAVKIDRNEPDKHNSNTPSAVSQSRIKNLETGLKFLEENIDQQKISAFRNSDQWEGDIRDHSLFYFFKEKTSELIALKSQTKNLQPRASDPNEKPRKEPEEIASEQNKVTAEEPRITDSTNTELSEEQSVLELFKKPSTPLKMPIAMNEVTPEKDLPPTLQLNQQSTSTCIVPSPFKRALFWPGPRQTKQSKRAKKEKVPSVITAKKWQEYHEKKQREKAAQEEIKKKNAEERKRKKEEQEKIKREKQEKKQLEKIKTCKVKKRKAHSSSDSDSYEEWQESGNSLDDISFSWNESLDQDSKVSEDEEQNSESNSEKEDNKRHSSTHLYKEGDYIIVSFPGKKKDYKYVCVIQEVCDNDEIEVVALKACNETKTSFKLDENDVSIIKVSQVKEKLEFPCIICAGDRLKYEFSKKLDVDG